MEPTPANVSRRHPVAAREEAAVDLARQDQVCVACPVCGSSRGATLCSASALAEQHRYLMQFYRRRWRRQSPATAADRVSIRWPNGKVETAAALAADRFYVAREGAGVQPGK